MFSSYINRSRAGKTSREVVSPRKRKQPVDHLHKVSKRSFIKHDSNDDQICWQFRKGKCKNGKRCKWSHVLESGKASKQTDSWTDTRGRNYNRSSSNRSPTKFGRTSPSFNNRNMGIGPPPSGRPFSGRSSARPKYQKEARSQKSYALPPPQPKKPSGPWESETDLPAPKKSVNTSNEKNPISILVEISQHMKLDLDWKPASSKKGQTLTVDLDGRFLAQASGANKKALKLAVAAKGVALLQRISRFVKLINRIRVGKHAFLVRNEAKATKKEGLLLLGDPSLCDALQPHNKGYKLLLKMGWDPAKGLGQTHQGLKDPVAVKLKDNVRLGRNKRGLGFADPEKQEATFTDGAERKVREFANSTLTQMQFSKDLTKEERALIHELAKKYHVKSKSVGKGESRSLFLFKYTK